jgi:general secretion pathway protein I
MELDNPGYPGTPVPHMIKKKRIGGFTLIEVLVAFAVLGIALTALLRIFSGDLKGIAESSDYVKAAIKADAFMREVLESEDLDAGSSWDDTTDDGYEIRVTVNESLEERTENLMVTLLDVDLTISWMRGERRRALKIRTAKVIPKGI